MIHKLLITVSFCFIIIILKSQTIEKDGYIIQQSGDTVYGKIITGDEMDNTIKCDFLNTQTNERVVYCPSDIKAYRFIDGSYYISKTVAINGEKRNLFLEFLMKGAVNIYYYRGKDHSLFFVEKEGSEPFLLEKKTKSVITEKQYRYFDRTMAGTRSEYKQDNNQYKGALIYYLQEYPDIAKLVYHRDLSQKNLLEIGEKYHNYICTDHECINYTKDIKNRRSISIGPVVGLHFENYSIGITYDDNVYGFKVFNSFAYGVEFEYTSDFFKNHFFIDGNVMFGSANYNYSFGNIDLSFIQYQFKLNNCLTRGQFKFFYNLGVAFYKSDETLAYTMDNSSLIHTKALTYRTWYPLANIGLSYLLNANNSFKIEGGGSFYTISFIEKNTDDGTYIRTGGRWGINLCYQHAFNFRF